MSALAQGGVPAASEPVSLEQQHKTVSGSLDAINSEIALSQDKLDRLEAEVASLKKDQATITAALIQSAKTDKKLSEDIEDAGQRLTALGEQEDGIKLSLRSRRKVLAEVLAALQRMGLNPPPAILVRPDDALALSVILTVFPRPVRLLVSSLPVSAKLLKAAMAVLISAKATRPHVFMRHWIMVLL